MATIYEQYNITVPEDPVLKMLFHEEDTILSLYLKLTSFQYMLYAYVLLYNSFIIYLVVNIVRKIGFRNIPDYIQITYFQCMMVVFSYYLVKSSFL
jgi:hypothetical protein